MTVDDSIKILKLIKELKIALTRAQEFEDGCIMRDMEKKYLDKKIEE